MTWGPDSARTRCSLQLGLAGRTLYFLREETGFPYSRFGQTSCALYWGGLGMARRAPGPACGLLYDW